MSITNARQYRITKVQLARFEHAIETAGADQYKALIEQDSFAHDVLLAQALQQAADLREQLEEYERLAGSKTMMLEIHSLADIPVALIHARVAAGLTQRELAQHLGVTQQQVQRDEQTGYAQASLERLQRVWQVLGAKLDGQVSITPMFHSLDETPSEDSSSVANVENVDQLPRGAEVI